ncbi:thioesterase domain-containing protein [Xenorhabdus sp. SGI240]|uniref:thioesterase domain-containing protein n=1 Tax=Xenorhabdus sp. SGI240 TaxID=3158262 RepID=UPI0032B769C3
MRVELEEIKVVLESLDFVESAAALVNEGRHGRNSLAVCIQISSNEKILQEKTGKDELVSVFKQKLSELIPDYMVPSVFVFVDSMPHTVNGKIDMRRIKTLIDERNVEELIAPRNSTEEAILEIWTSALGIEAISVTDDFFDLGGDSLNAVDIILSINARFNTKLPLHIIFTAPRIEKIARIIDKGLTEKSSRLVCLRSSGTKSPIFCWPGLGGYPINLRALAEKMTGERPFYGIQAFGINEDEIPYSSLEEMVSADIAEIRKIQKEGPYYLWGYSFGCNLAFEAAFQLEEMGEKVEQIVLLAPGMLKGLPTTNLSDEYDNKGLITLLFTVFSRNIDDPDLHECLKTSCNEVSFIEFVCQKYSISNSDLVRRISKVVIESQRISHERNNEAQKSITTPAYIFSALNDEFSVFENKIDCFRGGREIIKLNVTHFDFLMEPGVNHLMSLITKHVPSL